VSNLGNTSTPSSEGCGTITPTAGQSPIMIHEVGNDYCLSPSDESLGHRMQSSGSARLRLPGPGIAR
jgi:hypothetical protein